MHKLLVLSSRNIFSHGGERNLMEGKSVELAKHGWQTQYVSLRLKGRYKNVPSDLRYDVIANRSLSDGLLYPQHFARLVERIEPNVIQFSGIWAYLVYARYKKYIDFTQYTISLDYQGALEELPEFASGMLGVWKHVVYSIIKPFEKRMFRESDIVEIVSENCRTHLIRSYGETRSRFVRVPCNLNRTFSSDEYCTYRSYWRSRLGLKGKELAAVYAGGISAWQCIGDVLRFAEGAKFRVFILTSEANKELISNQPVPSNITLMSFSPSEMRECLTAFDYGLLPRDNLITNYVAYPNKFAEYYNARLTVLLKSSEIGVFEDFDDVCRVIDYDGLQIPQPVDKSLFDEKRVLFRESVGDLVSAYTAEVES